MDMSDLQVESEKTVSSWFYWTLSLCAQSGWCRFKKIYEFNMNELQKLAWFHPNESIDRILEIINPHCKWFMVNPGLSLQQQIN